MTGLVHGVWVGCMWGAVMVAVICLLDGSGRQQAGYQVNLGPSSCGLLDEKGGSS